MPTIICFVAAAGSLYIALVKDKPAGTSFLIASGCLAIVGIAFLFT